MAFRASPSPPPVSLAPGREAPPLFPRRSLIALVLAVVVGIGALAALAHSEWPQVQQFVARLNTPATLALMAVLPLAGFSVSIVHLMAGAKFGLAAGGLVVAGLTVFHLLASYAAVRWLLRAPIERWLQRRRHHLPHIPTDDDVAAAVLAAIVPGIPYFIRNYFLPIAGVPLRVYFWICLPIYVAHAYFALYLVAIAADPGGLRLLLLGVVYAVKLALCAEIIRRIRRRHRHQAAPGWP